MKKIAAFLDFENLAISAGKKKVGGSDKLNLEALISYMSCFGEIVQIQAFGDFRNPRLNNYNQKFKDLGIQKVHRHAETAARKAPTDVNMAVQVVRKLYTDPSIDVYFVCSSDSDFLPVLNEVKRIGKIAGVVGFNYNISRQLKLAASLYFSYEDLMDMSMPMKLAG